MTAKEICRKYNDSADKVEMIQVLADSEVCTKQDIIELLKNNGCEIPEQCRRGRRWKKKEKEQMPDIVRTALEEKMEKIDRNIKELEPIKNQYDELVKQYEEIAAYLCSS